MPPGYAFSDKNGDKRRNIRLKWWGDTGRGWRDRAISVPDPADLPEGDLHGAPVDRYPSDDLPVFFGHYWLEGTPVLQSANTLCLDYSAGKDGPLVTYEFQPEDAGLSVDRIRVHGAGCGLG